MRSVILSALLISAGFRAILGQSNPPATSQGSAQQPGGSSAASSTSASSKTSDEPLTVGEKFKLSWRRSFDPMEAVRATIGAGLDQWRDYPSDWGEGWDSFGVRMASHVGQHWIKEEIEFGVEAFDHEDPRHRKSGLTGLWPRTRYAVVHTFVRRKDNGGMMPAYSRFIGDYGAGLISRQWYPARFHSVGDGLEGGTISLGLDAGMSVLREFWPSRK